MGHVYKIHSVFRKTKLYSISYTSLNQLSLETLLIGIVFMTAFLNYQQFPATFKWPSDGEFLSILKLPLGSCPTEFRDLHQYNNANGIKTGKLPFVQKREEKVTNSPPL
jgi:hypothetical protein